MCSFDISVRSLHYFEYTFIFKARFKHGNFGLYVEFYEKKFFSNYAFCVLLFYLFVMIEILYNSLSLIIWSLAPLDPISPLPKNLGYLT